MHKLWMLVQVGAQARYVPCVEKIHGATKRAVLDPLMVRQIQVIGERRFLDAPLQSGPAREPVLTSDCELRAAET